MVEDLESEGEGTKSATESRTKFLKKNYIACPQLNP